MLFAAGSAGAQRTSAPAGTPMVCTEAMERFRNEKYQAGRTAHKDVDWKTVDSMMIAQGKRCAANLDVSKVHGAELIDLAGLYSRLGDLDATDRVFGRISSDAAIPDSVRADLLLNAERAYGWYGGPRDDTVARARARATPGALARHVDSMDVSPLRHFRARAVEVEAAAEEPWNVRAESARSLLALAYKLPAPVQRDTSIVNDVLGAALELAAGEANNLNVDSARATLAGTATFPAVAAALADSTNRYAHERWMSAQQLYSLVGKPAPALHVDAWTNGPAASLTGKVSLLMFTAHWCHPCLTSYPTVVAITHELAAKGFQTVLVIDLEGSWDGKNLTRAAEVEANRHYYGDEHGFPAPIALQSPLRIERMGKPRPMDHDNMDRYGAGSIPTYVVVDRAGIVRAVLIDWDTGGAQERNLRTAIGRLLSDTSSPSRGD
jgi:thiol-disulfide isomerase/thioredoxin